MVRIKWKIDLSLHSITEILVTEPLMNFSTSDKDEKREPDWWKLEDSEVDIFVKNDSSTTVPNNQIQEMTIIYSENNEIYE